jgi:hypothetical protein
LQQRYDVFIDSAMSHLGHRLDNLIARYEEPSSMVRWDSPLFTIPWSEPDIPIELIWKSITEGNVKPPNAGTQAVSDLYHASVLGSYTFCLGAKGTL